LTILPVRGFSPAPVNPRAETRTPSSSSQTAAASATSSSARTISRVYVAKALARLPTCGGPPCARVSQHHLRHSSSSQSNTYTDALSLKKDGDATFTGGGATGVSDKVIQHNGAGTVTIDGFTVDTFGKLYRSCGNCKQSAKRNVVIKNVKAFNGKLLVGINSNFGDTATIDSATCLPSS
jgi:hypothetical protein